MNQTVFINVQVTDKKPQGQHHNLIFSSTCDAKQAPHLLWGGDWDADPDPNKPSFGLFLSMARSRSASMSMALMCVADGLKSITGTRLPCVLI